MDNDQFKTPLNKSRLPGPGLRSSTMKRDSFAAELERDPQTSTAKRQQRAQVFTSSISHASLERQLLAAQTSKMELETKLRESELLIATLKSDREWLANREKEEREEKEAERESYEKAKKASDAENRSLRITVSTLREELADLQDTHQALVRNTNQTVSSQKTEIMTLTHRNALLEQQYEQAKTLAEERSESLTQLQAAYDELSTAKESSEKRELEEESMSIVRDELHRQASYLRSLESSNAKMTAELKVLRERQTSVEVLREEKRGLERKLQMLDEFRTKAIKLEAEVEAGRKEREAWAENSQNAQLSSTPIAVTKALSDLRLAHARLLEEHGSTVALLRQREAELADYERREAQSTQNISTLEQNQRILKDKIARRDARTQLAEREVTFLQALVASFNAEDHMEGVERDEAKDQHIQQLQGLLQEYKALNDQLSDNLENLDGKPSLLNPAQAEELHAELEKERLEKAELQKGLDAATTSEKENLDKIEELEQTLFELRGEIAGGRHVPPNTRILSMKDNPEQQWFDLRQAAMDRLKSENEALIKRLKELEEGGVRMTNEGEGAGEDLVPRESWEAVNKEKVDLEEMVKQKEKRLLRLQQVFTSKSAEFREAIASILGLKLAFYPNGQVRVTSVYDLCASFVFQPSRGQGSSSAGSASMQLVAQGEGGPQDLPNLMEYWIEKEQCIPGFLASVTLECYDNAKREGRIDV
ncbi:Spindle assembly checkpoint component mad1 [Psilocybe cubensis]|uniref:Spindle assembly checkpoint component mad1 n=2 Tax=Psilocybe cubensis TaxID=181762 RepID=A0ACB8GJH0_PSICU|nr:Spindle assembly checkpoint component mad1 [Psilocybe cubensis]KAH9475542.1 Spindle assembly checkpoint component mad1 [Psilocybe cubensis]